MSLKHFDELGDVADHCGFCHKCLNPCPAEIDLGDVLVAMRYFLRRHGKKKFNLGTAAAMFYLDTSDPVTIKAAGNVMIEWG